MDKIDLEEYMTAADAAVRELAKRAELPAPSTTCPYCSRPEGWDACPVHPHTPPPTPHAQS